MPTLTLVSERRPVKVHEINSLVVNIGRGEDMDVVIDSACVSRRQAQIRLEPSGAWSVVDLGSANGTFLNGRRILARQPLARGDEISFGPFSLFFDRAFTGPALEAPARRAGRRTAESPGPSPRPTDTTRMDRRDVARLQHEAARKRRAHLAWRADSVQGMHFLERVNGAAILIGRSDLCDLRVPAGPRHHLLVIRTGGRYEVRNLSGWHRMTVNGVIARRAVLADGDEVEIARLHLVFADDLE
jgi:pSer/pThr/pTyr-binding forkhead associated (FHA) protein